MISWLSIFWPLFYLKSAILLNISTLADLRLYRETPKSGLSSHWSVAVGPTIQQWTSFIDSLGPDGDESDMCSFLKKDLFSIVQDCIGESQMYEVLEDLNPILILEKEATLLTKIRQKGGMTDISTLKSSVSPASQTSTSLVMEGGSAASSSGNSTSTCPPTPPNGTPSAQPCAVPVSQAPVLTPESSTAPVKISLTAPNTPCKCFISPVQWLCFSGFFLFLMT